MKEEKKKKLLIITQILLNSVINISMETAYSMVNKVAGHTTVVLFFFKFAFSKNILLIMSLCS